MIDSAKMPPRLWYECLACGNRCLWPDGSEKPGEERPDNTICGGCARTGDKPNWRLLRSQMAYRKGDSDWVHPLGEI